MANTTKALVLIIAPELTDVDNPTWDTILNDVADDVSVSVFGTKQERAQRYLAAHLLTLSRPENNNPHASGPITSERTGPLAVSYGSISNSKGELDSTVYGREFVRIRKGCIVNIKSFIPGIVSSI